MLVPCPITDWYLRGVVELGNWRSDTRWVDPRLLLLLTCIGGMTERAFGQWEQLLSLSNFGVILGHSLAGICG